MSRLQALCIVLRCSALLVSGGTVATAQQVALYGNLEEGRYLSPTGEFSIEVPVLPELGGEITDTPEVVTFRDAFTKHASIACFRMDATQRWENETRGTRDYLIWFFGQVVQSDFRRRYPGAEIESARFMPDLLGGSLLVFNLLPGGTMFGERVPQGPEDGPPVAKRGNLLFVHHEHIYVVSTELAEKVLQPRTFDLSIEEQDEKLRTRLLDLISDIQFRIPLAEPEQLSALGQH